MTPLNPRPLTLFGLFVAAFGLFLCFAGFAATLMGVDFMFKLFHPGEGHAVWSEHMRFSTGLMGAVSLGWGLTLYAKAKHSAAMPAATAKALWASVTIGMVIWFVIDTIISVANGYWVNGISNLCVVALYLLAIRLSGVMRS